jgi:hypothetical protein
MNLNTYLKLLAWCFLSDIRTIPIDHSREVHVTNLSSITFARMSSNAAGRLGVRDRSDAQSRTLAK